MKHRADVVEEELEQDAEAAPSTGRHAALTEAPEPLPEPDEVPGEVEPVQDTAEVPEDIKAEHARAGTSPTQTYKWRARHHLRSFTFLLLLASAAALGMTGRLFAEARTNDRMEWLVCAALAVAGLWALLTATAPQVVTLRGSILTVKGRRGVERFDLAEGMQQVDLVGDPTSSKWSLVLHRPDCSTLQLDRRDVHAPTLDPLVRSLRNVAEHRRAEHWARLGL
jgi:hypothetical protein